MKKLSFDQYEKVFCISHPLDKTNNCLLYCIDVDLVCNIIDEILEKHGIDVYYIDYNMGMTEYLCLIHVNYMTNEETMKKALKEIVDTISKPKYCWK